MSSKNTLLELMWGVLFMGLVEDSLRTDAAMSQNRNQLFFGLEV